MYVSQLTANTTTKTKIKLSNIFYFSYSALLQEFVDTKGAIRFLNSKKDKTTQ